jgi:hypothetical protein
VAGRRYAAKYALISIMRERPGGIATPAVPTCSVKDRGFGIAGAGNGSTGSTGTTGSEVMATTGSMLHDPTVPPPVEWLEELLLEAWLEELLLEAWLDELLDASPGEELKTMALITYCRFGGSSGPTPLKVTRTCPGSTVVTAERLP